MILNLLYYEIKNLIINYIFNLIVNIQFNNQTIIFLYFGRIISYLYGIVLLQNTTLEIIFNIKIQNKS